MAVFRNGTIALFIVLVATAFVASATALATPCLCSSDPDAECCWLEYVTGEAKRQAEAVSIQADGDVTTTALAPMGKTIVVDSNGKGDYKTIQAAINSVPKDNKYRVIIKINNGVYRQKLIIKKRDFIYFKCQSKLAVITWGDTAAEAGGTSLSASTAIESDGFIASDCTFVNSAPQPEGGAVGKQAVALRIQGDKGSFYRCAFYGAQDTLYDKEGRHHFRSCFIQGSIDFIFGDGQSFYQYCQLVSIAKANSGSVTAQKRESNSKTGFVFFQCALSGSGTIYLGRAWGTHSRVIFYQCSIANSIRPERYQDWEDPSRQKTVYYAEYDCSGPGANRNGAVKWSKVLTTAQAKPFSSIAFIDGKSWLEPPM